MNKKVLLSSLMSIAMLASITTGATYALFTAEDSANIAVNSAKVKVEAKVLPEFEYKSLDTEFASTESGKAVFSSGGTAEVDSNGNILLDRIVPGDEVEFTVRVVNDSNIDISYRLYCVVDGELANALEYTKINTKELSDWELWSSNSSNTKDINFNIKLPSSVKNEYQEKSCNIQIVVEAVQSNASNLVLLNGTKYDSLDSAVAVANEGDLIQISGKVKLQGAEGTSETLDLKGVTIEGLTDYTSLTFVNYGDRKDTGTGTFANANLKNLTVIDETFYTGENGENAWEFTYLEFSGESSFENVQFTDGIFLEGIDGNATFTNCSFAGHNNDSSTYGNTTMYGAWVYSGDATFTNCSFTGTRGLKVADQYSGSDVKEVVVDGCTFGPLSEKPGIAVDNRIGSLKLIIKNSTFNGTQPGDQGNYIYENDNGTPETTEIILENNAVNAIVNNSTDLTSSLTNAPEGSTIVLEEGTYEDNLNGLPTGVTIEGNGEVVVDGGDGIALTGSFENVTVKNLTFSGARAVRWTYSKGNNVFENCTFDGEVYGYHVDDANDGTVTFNNCTFIGFNAFAHNGSYYFNNCTFLFSGSYGHTNMWGKGYFNNCTFGDATSLSTGGENGYLEINGVDETKYSFEFIGSADSLFAFAENVNKSKDASDYSMTKVMLIADIDLENRDWEPIGQTGATEFKGIFDGQNHTIYNLNVNSYDETGAHYSSGLFGWLEGHSEKGHSENYIVIKNLTIDGATILGNHNCGVIAGYATGTTLIDNCKVINAKVDAKVYDTEANGDKAGAIVGNLTSDEDTLLSNSSAENCVITAGRDAGQICGASSEKNVSNCKALSVQVSFNDTGANSNIRNEIIGRVLS